MEKLLIKDKLIAISNRLGHLTSEALRADTLFKLVAVEQLNAKLNEKVEYAAVIKLLENYIENGNFKLAPTDLGVGKDKEDIIKNLLTEIIKKNDSDSDLFFLNLD